MMQDMLYVMMQVMLQCNDAGTCSIRLCHNVMMQNMLDVMMQVLLQCNDQCRLCYNVMINAGYATM